MNFILQLYKSTWSWYAYILCRTVH